MQRVLFVSNGHGEVAIAARIARALRAAAGPYGPALDHLALVGRGGAEGDFTLVGPRRAMPSGGLVAMGNVRAIAGDVAAGFARLFAQQLGFVLAHGGRYDAVVAVGDVYALGFALCARAPNAPLFVGTAKSLYVAPYGPFERVLLRRAARVFVRDRPTAERLRAQGVAAEAPGNVIVDLATDSVAAAVPPSPGALEIAVLPGSRERAYLDGLRLARVIRALAAELSAPVRARFSVAPGLSAERFATVLGTDGWTLAPAAAVHDASVFSARSGLAEVVGIRGPVGDLLRASTLVAGQAGTANEEAAALGVPVVALAAPPPDRGGRGDGWYRMRQRRLLGEALALVPSEPGAAARSIAELLRSPQRLAAMRAAGRERMGPPGGSDAIARAILDRLDESLR